MDTEPWRLMCTPGGVHSIWYLRAEMGYVTDTIDIQKFKFDVTLDD